MNEKHYKVFGGEVENFLKEFKGEYFGPEQKEMGVHLTLGVTPVESGFDWNYQTGDNSFTGGAYGHPHWINIYLMRRSNCKVLSKEAVEQLRDLVAQTT